MFIELVGSLENLLNLPRISTRFLEILENSNDFKKLELRGAPENS